MTKEEFNNKDSDIYEDDSREELEENDEIDEAEEGFMQGYEQDKDPGTCAQCNSILIGSDIHEEEFGEETLRFCSTDCAAKYKKEH
jgi:hypothetical protein